MYEDPLISCLCVTWGRPSLLRRSIEIFNNQTYMNRQLVVICRDSDTITLNLLHEINQNNIKIVSVENAHQMKLGELRNLSIDNSDGEYVCQWDDDDWYHPHRVQDQYTAIKESNKSGSILSYILMFDAKEKYAYLSPRRAWENSFMCERKLIIDKAIKFPDLDKAEDTPFINELIDLNVLVPLVKPELYIYNNTGSNTCDPSHFEKLYGWAQRLSDYHSEVICNLVLHHSDKEIVELSASRFIRGYRFVQKLPEGFDLLYSNLNDCLAV